MSFSVQRCHGSTLPWSAASGPVCYMMLFFFLGIHAIYPYINTHGRFFLKETPMGFSFENKHPGRIKYTQTLDWHVQVVYLFLDLEQRLHFRPWISRVSSHSNISDGPSRGSFEELHKLGAECFLFPQEVLTFIMTDFKSKHMINDANA